MGNGHRLEIWRRMDCCERITQMRWEKRADLGILVINRWIVNLWMVHDFCGGLHKHLRTGTLVPWRVWNICVLKILMQ